MATIVNVKLGENRGKKRVWLEGQKLAREGFEPGMKLDMQLQDSKLVLRVAPTGRYTISKRERNGRVSPIIDVMAGELASLFEGVEMLRVLIRDGVIVVTAHQQHDRIRERVKRLISKLERDEPLAVCSLFHGGGVLDKALHSGLAQAGVKSTVAVAVEIEAQYLDASLRNNPELWSEDSCVIESPIEAVNISRNPTQVDFVIGGIPCTGASKAGRAKNKLEFAESHSAAGAMFFNFLQFVSAMNPACVLIENVPDYAHTASMEVIRSVLGSLGYVVQERVLDGNEFGALEKRKRLCVVALSKGLEKVFDLDGVMPIREAEASLAEVLEPLPLDSERWKTFDYLAEKEARDMAAGKGFSRQLLTGDEPSCGTIGRDYSKCRSTEPFLQHPEDPSLSRILTPAEHARVKAIPQSVIAGLSDTVAHQVLGQSIVFPVFQAVALYLGNAFRRAAGMVSELPRRFLEPVSFTTRLIERASAASEPQLELFAG